MAVGRRKWKQLARRSVALAFTILILAQNAFIPRSRANVVEVKLGQKTFVFWEYCGDLQSWGSKAGTNPYKRLMMVNESNIFFNGTKSNYTKSGHIGFDCGHSTQNSDFPGQWQVSHNEMFMSESGFNTPYIDYSEHFSSSDNNRGYDIHAWNIYLSDSNDKRTNTAFTAAYRYGYEQLGYLDRDKGADGEGSGGTIASNAEVHPWMTSGSNKFFHYDPQSKDPNEGLQGKGNSWYLQDWSTSNFDRSYNNGTSMKVFLGREKAIDAIKDNFSVEYDQITVMGRKIEYICPGVTITVKRGGVLTVDGALINDGKIVVEDGGLMAIKKDAVIMPLFFNKSDRGGITSSGNIIIRSGGAMIGGGSNGIYLSGGTVVNLGIMASENFTIKRDYTIENKSSGQIYVGKTINGTLVSRMISDIDSGKLGNSFKVSDITEDTLHNYLSSVKVSVPSNPTYGNGTYKRF